MRMLSICIDGYGIVLPSCSVSGMSGLCFHYMQPSLKSSFIYRWLWRMRSSRFVCKAKLTGHFF